MQFYKIKCDIIKDENECVEENERRDRRDLANQICEATETFNFGETSSYYFIADMKGDTLTVGAIDMCADSVKTKAECLTAMVDINAKGCSFEEITMSNMNSLLNQASRRAYVDDPTAVLERFGLDRLMGARGRGLEFGENLVESSATKDEIYKRAKELFVSDTLIPELDRMYASHGKSKGAKGHPVHYIVECDNRDIRREMYRLILDALHDNKRLENCRYAFLDFRPGEGYSKLNYEALYKASFGGAVVVRYIAEDDSGDEYDLSGEHDTIEHICEMAKKYRNQVLTVICFPRECNKVKNMFYENLGTMAFVETREDFLDGEKAKEYLKLLARERQVRSDKKLFVNIREEETYLATELRGVFDEWYNGKLKTTVYPQYKDVAAVRHEVVKAKPRGSAYDELSEMIGLANAKQVIKKALNFYKMQKIYESSGVKRDNPAMHMIFSGNPGTAKTTVARLFARIMRENGLLSSGHLVEVGRADLVAKYVGWTAQTVKEKFKRAMGGVLFIDEAYALADDKGGSFGDEAINTIVQEMENRRGEVVVIFAGYPDKMEGFLQKNPGLRSRIAFHVPFEDYDSTELCEIADMISRKNGMKIDKEARNKLERAFDEARTVADFGNGRYVRNIFEQAKMNQASRLLEGDIDELTTEEVVTITADDIIIPKSTAAPERRIGFC